MKVRPQTQSPPHEPFPVADFQVGLYLPKEPWLSPRNAFRKLENSRVFRGRLQKRSGFVRFSEITAASADSTVLAVSAGGDPLVMTYRIDPASTARIVPESVLFTSDNGAGPDITAQLDINSERWIATGDTPNPYIGASYEIWVWDIVETGTTTVMGAFFYDPTPPFSVGCAGIIDWELHSGYVDRATDDGSMAYRLTEITDITGLVRYRNKDGDFSLAFDENRPYLYDASAGYYKPQGTGASFADFLTADSEDYVWTWPLHNYLVFTNGVDPVYSWDPTASANDSCVEMDTDWAGGSNELDTCRLVLAFQSRLLYFNTTESATRFPTRVRWTLAGSFTAWNSPLDFLDAPTDLGEIVTAEFIGERLFVGFDSGWMELIYTGDANKPFDWRPFISRFGAVSKLSTIPDNERVLSRSKTTMQGLDPTGQFYIDQEVPDLVGSFSADAFHLCSGVRNEDQKSFWWTYADSGESRPDHILNATYDEAGQLSWSTYDLSMNVFSEFDSLQTPTWNSLGPLTWNELGSVTWNDARVGIAGFTQIIAGGQAGMVYRFGTGSKDNYPAGPQNIPLSIEGQKWAPYPGQRAHWGWLDLYADASSTSQMVLYFYADSESAAYETKTLTLEPSLGSQKIYKRIKVDRTALFHRIKIVSEGAAPLVIDALVPWFRPAGRAKEFGNA